MILLAASTYYYSIARSGLVCTVLAPIYLDTIYKLDIQAS